MQSPSDLNQAVQSLQREMQKVLDDIKQHENLLRETQSRSNAFDQEVKKEDAEIRQKQQEILRLQQDMDNKKRELLASQKTEARLKQEVERLKLEQIQKTNALNTMSRQQRDTLMQQNIRH